MAGPKNGLWSAVVHKVQVLREQREPLSETEQGSDILAVEKSAGSIFLQSE